MPRGVAGATIRRFRREVASMKRDVAKLNTLQRKAAVTAINRVGRDIERKGVAELSEKTKFAKGVIRWHGMLDGTRTKKRRFVMQKATKDEVAVWYFWAPRSARPVINFATLRTRQTKKGVRAGNHMLPGAFVPQRGVKRLGPKVGGVFKRVGESRRPIEWQAQDIRDEADEIFARLVDASGPQFEKEYDRLLARAMKKEAAKKAPKRSITLGAGGISIS